jgi:hypothetical protein
VGCSFRDHRFADALQFEGSMPVLINCVVKGPEGHGVSLLDESSALLVNCTLTGHGVAAIQTIESQLMVRNSIVWGNGASIEAPDSEPSITYSDIEGGAPGEGNIDRDPMFVDDEDDFRLRAGSPCIDAADNDAVPEGIDEDIDGLPRFVDDPDTKDTGRGEPPIVDMGAYEFQPGECAADFDQDGLVGFDDLIALLAAWGSEGGPEDLDGDGRVGFNDLIALLVAWGPCM